MSLTFGQLINKLSQNQNINDLSQEYKFEIFETMIRLVKFKQGYQFYKLNLENFNIDELDFLNFTVKDNIPVYDMLLKQNDRYEIYQIKNTNSININHELSVKQLADKINAKYVIILDDQYQFWLDQFNQLNFVQEKKTIQLKDYQLKYYDQLCELVEKNKLSCLSLPPRFGKTYLMGKFIQEHPEVKVCVLTSYPSECFPVYNKIQSEYNFNFKYESKQYFREEDYGEKVKEFQDFDLFFLDEFHYCGNTSLTQQVLKTLGKKLCYVSGTPFRLIQTQNLPYITISKEDFENIDFPTLQINYQVNNELQNIHLLEVSKQKRLIHEELKSKTLVNDTFVYLETNGNFEYQQLVVKKQLDPQIQIFCEKNKVGGTFPNLFNIFVMNNNMNELLIQQIFRLMNPSVGTKQCFIYNFQQIINIIQFFQKLFSLDFSILEFDKILPKQIKLNIDKDLIKTYLCQQTVKLTCVNENNQKYIQSKLLEKLNDTIKGTRDKIKVNEYKEKIDKFIEEIHSIKDEKIHPMILVIERVSTFVVIMNWFNKDKKYDEKQQDYLLKDLYKQMPRQNKLKLKDIINGMFSSNLITDGYDFKIDFICRLFDVENKSQLIYNYYNQFEQLIKSQDKIILYEQFMQNMCNTTNFEKKQNAEILTPIWLVKEMIQQGSQYIDCLKEHQTSLPKIIEPCCGKGAFLVCLYEHLFSLNYSQKEILEEILVFNDINQFNIQICKLLLDPENKYKLQYKNQNALTLSYEDYDLVITNPPYNEDKGDQQAKMKQIYQQFSLQFKRAKYSMAIIKTNWCLDQRKIFKEFRQKFIPNLKLIKTFNINIFNNVDIKGGIMYYINEKNYIGECVVNNIKQQLNKDYQLFINGNLEIPKDTLLNHFTYLSQGYFLKLSHQDLFQDNEFENSVQCIESKQHGQNIRWISKDLLVNQPFRDKWICATPSAATGTNQGIIRCVILNPGQIFCKSYIGFVCDSESQAKILSDYLLSEKSQTLIKKLKFSQNVSKQIFEYHPYIKDLFE